MPSPRWFFAITALACAGLLAYGYYLQFHDGLEPCPMCVFQRLCYMAVLGVSLVALIHGPGPRASRIYAGLAVLAASIGEAIAARQVWLQHLPEDQVPECGPGLEFMLEVYPFFDVIKTALKGTGECASVNWTFLSLSIAEWSLVCFMAIVMCQIWFISSSFRHN